MSIDISNIYKTDSGSNIQYIVPLVVFYKGTRCDDFDTIDSVSDSDKIFLSSQNIEFEGNYYLPLLKKIPSVKESIDIQTGQFRIKSTQIEIDNSLFHGTRFSDNIKDIVNCAVRIYYKTQSCKTLDDCTLITQSTVLRYTQKKNTLKIELEGPTEISLSKSIPEIVPDENQYAKNDRLGVFPMVYGYVNRSPVIKKIDPLLSDSDGNQSVNVLVADTLPVSGLVLDYENQYLPSPVKETIGNASPVYVYDEDYLNLLNSVPNEYSEFFENDYSGVLFEISENEIITTSLFAEFQSVINDEFGFSAPAVGRVWRKFVGLEGHRKSFIEDLGNGEITFGGHLFATSNWADDVWGGFAGKPRLWWDRMWNDDNYITRDNVCFPFDTDETQNWDRDMSLTNSSWNQGPDDEDDASVKGKLLEGWNIPASDNYDSWTIRPNDYLDFIQHNDSRALGLYGEGHSRAEDSGSYVYWNFELDNFNVKGNCISYWLGKVIAYANNAEDYSPNYTDQWLSGGAAWAGSREIPRYPATFNVTDVGHSWWYQGGGAWREFPAFSASEDFGYNDGGGRIVHDNLTKGLDRIEGWDTSDQFSSVIVGQPYYTDEHHEQTRAMMHTTLAINYAHIIQDVFIEESDTKDWYVNINGRKGEEFISWRPFNTWSPQVVPNYVDIDDEAAVEQYFYDMKYLGPQAGGERGWLVNVGKQFNLIGYLDDSDLDIIPERMWFMTPLNSSPTKFRDGEWETNRVIDVGDPFVLFTSEKITIKTFFMGYGEDDYSKYSRFIRMHSNGQEWEEGFYPSAAYDKVEEFYSEYGWKNYQYQPELNIDGMVESPHHIIQHLLASEVGYGVNYFDEDVLHKCSATHQGWRMGFTLKEQKKLKEVIEGVCSETKLFPRFRSDGKFTFTTIKDFYNMSDINFSIEKSEVIDWTFGVTKTEDVFSKHQILFEYDYAKEDFNKEVKPESIITQGTIQNWEFTIDAWSGYQNITEFLYQDIGKDNWIYNIEDLYNKKDDEDIKITEAMYIRDRYTAEEFRKYKMMDSINQHITIGLTLTNKYSNIETGDIIYINKLSDESAFGYKYWGYEIKGGQLIYPFWLITEVNKTGANISIKCIQLHRLQYGLPKWLVENTLIDNDYKLPDNPNSISQAIDDGGVYDLSLNNLDIRFQSIHEDIQTDVNDYFHLEWYPNDYANLLNYTEGSLIRLNIIQNPIGYGELGVDWSAEVMEDGEWYSDSSPRFELITYNNPDDFYNGYVIVKSRLENDTNSYIDGQIKITTTEGQSWVKNFSQINNDGIEPDEDGSGDVNVDGIINILDIIMMVAYVVGEAELSEEQIAIGDLNGDGGINIQDIVALVNRILE